MKPQSAMLLSVLCVLLFPGPVLSVESVPTNGSTTATQTPANISITRMVLTTEAMITQTSTGTDKGITGTKSLYPTGATIRPFTLKTSPSFFTSVQTEMCTTAGTKNSQRVPAITIVLLILFFLVLIMLCVCVYKWYSHNLEQHSFRELRRSIVRSVRTSRAAGILERLRPSRKQKEDEVDMEEGGVEETGEGQEQQGQDEDDDTSDDYSSMDGAVMMAKAKQEEEPEDDSTTSDEEEEAPEEKTEGAKDDLTKL